MGGRLLGVKIIKHKRIAYIYSKYLISIEL